MFSSVLFLHHISVAHIHMDRNKTQLLQKDLTPSHKHIDKMALVQIGLLVRSANAEMLARTLVNSNQIKNISFLQFPVGFKCFLWHQSIKIWSWPCF